MLPEAKLSRNTHGGALAIGSAKEVFGSGRGKKGKGGGTFACCVQAKWVEISINWRRKLPRKQTDGLAVRPARNCKGAAAGQQQKQQHLNELPSTDEANSMQHAT